MAGRSAVKRGFPTGTITFMFTDIEGSTQRWERDRNAMADALHRHDRLVREAIETHGGTVFKTVGDAFCGAFSRPDSAIRAAIQVQQTILAQDFSAVAGLRVRIALHSGTADERAGDYFGPAVNRVARLLAIAHGGQILLSSTTAEFERASLPAQAQLRDLGEHRLKDLDFTEHVYQLVAPALQHDFPPLLSLSVTNNNLPAQLTPLVGREAEPAQIRDRLARHRILTLVGAGGVGKTRIALQVGSSALGAFSDGVWFVELAALQDARLIPSTIARALNLQLDDDTLPSLTSAMQRMRLLLILDNCEHLIEGAAEAIAAIVQRCPNVTVVATSRQPLEITGETTYRLPSLPMEYAMRLFAVRAQSADARFSLTDANAATVEDICRRLDGIPLAIELAAARVKLLSPNQLRRRLDERFAILVGGPRDKLPRQQTMRAVIDWSYDLLGEDERTLLQRLSIFSGGWSLDAAEVVCAFEPVSPDNVFHLHESLLDKSLLIAELEADQPRYRLLESNRSYAVEKLSESGSRLMLEERHAGWFADLVENFGRRFTNAPAEQLHAELAPDIDNVRAALSWSLADGADSKDGRRIAATLGDLWNDLGLSEEARRWIELAVSRECRDEPAHVEPRLWTALARVSAPVRAVEAADRAIGLYETLGDKKGCVRAYQRRSHALLNMQRLDDARIAAERARALVMEIEGRKGSDYARITGILGSIAADQGRIDEARLLFKEAIEIDTRAPDAARLNAVNTFNLADLEYNAGNCALAISLVEKAIAVAVRLRLDTFCGAALCNASGYRLATGDLDRALSDARKGLEIAVGCRYSPVVALAIQHVATVAAIRGDAACAATLLGYVDAWCEPSGYKRIACERNGYDMAMSALRDELDEEEMGSLQMEGAALTEEAAAAQARLIVEGGRAARA